MSHVQEITVTALPALLATGTINLVDVRNDNETASGIIRGARKIPLHLLPLQISQLNAATPTVFYCHLGGRSAQAAAFALNQGFTEVYNMSGGITAWLQNGGEVTR